MSTPTLNPVRTITVEVWSDVACPWCYIGKRRFAAALEAFPHRAHVEVVWRSYQLSPDTPRGPGRRHHRALSLRFPGTVTVRSSTRPSIVGILASVSIASRNPADPRGLESSRDPRKRSRSIRPRPRRASSPVAVEREERDVVLASP